VRSEHVALTVPEDDRRGSGSGVEGVVVDAFGLGTTVSTVVDLGGGAEIELIDPGGDVVAPGTRCRIVVAPGALHLWAAGSPADASPGDGGPGDGGRALSGSVPGPLQ
jgi:hypothetical protein